MYKYDSLKAFVDDLERYKDSTDIKVDLISITFETLNYLKSIVDVKQLEAKIAASKSVNTKSLSILLEEIEKLNLSNISFKIAEGIERKYDDLYDDLKSFISKIAQIDHKSETSDISFKIDLVGDRILCEIFICAVSKQISLKNIESMVLSVLEKLDDNTIFILWDRVLGEFDTYRQHPMKVEEGIITLDFLKKEDAAYTKQKLAEYMVRLKPELIKRRFDCGITSYPNESIGALRVIALRETDIKTQLGEWEVTLARSISRLAFFWEEWLKEDLHSIAGLLEIDVNSSILSGSDYTIAKKEPKPLNNSYAFLQIRKILHIAGSRFSLGTPVEKALLQYKLGIEVMMPDVKKEYEGKKELTLQRELCKFLIERDIYAIGTKFGRNEIDLIAEHAPNSFIIETKIYRKKATLSESALRKNISQLQDYMQSSQIYRKGILVVYNMTDWLLCSPREWIHGQFSILAINLNDKSASGKEKALTIFESNDNTLIRVEKT